MALGPQCSGGCCAVVATGGRNTWKPDGQTDTFSFERITFASFARSGAKVLDGLVDPQQGADDFVGVGQLEECRRTVRKRRIDVLLINIGGNDAGFSGVLTDLVGRDSIYTGSLSGTLKALVKSPVAGVPGGDALGRQQVEKQLMHLLGVGLPPEHKGELEQHYDVLHDRVEDLANDPGIGDVYITGYPIGFLENRAPDGRLFFKSCEIFSGPDADMTGADGKMIQRIGRELNKLIARKATEFGWHFIDVEKAFEGHGYCGPR